MLSHFFLLDTGSHIKRRTGRTCVHTLGEFSCASAPGAVTKTGGGKSAFRAGRVFTRSAQDTGAGPGGQLQGDRVQVVTHDRLVEGEEGQG